MVDGPKETESSNKQEPLPTSDHGNVRKEHLYKYLKAFCTKHDPDRVGKKLVKAAARFVDNQGDLNDMLRKQYGVDLTSMEGYETQLKPAEDLQKPEASLKPAEPVPPPAPIPEKNYKPPSWGGKPTIKYELEVLKNGVVIENVSIGDKDHYLFGRQPENCDIVVGHGSVSRQHTVLQHAQDGALFMYVADTKWVLKGCPYVLIMLLSPAVVLLPFLLLVVLFLSKKCLQS
jgi:hypothetical protein